MFALSLVAMVQTPAFADPEDIPIRSIRPNGDTHRNPEMIPFFCSVDVDVLCLYVSFLSNIGIVDIELNNYLTGEYSLTSIDSATGGTIIPFSGSSGTWVITFTLASGEEYVGEFEI